MILITKGTRNTGKSLAGKNVANPVGSLFAGANMLKYIGYVRMLTVVVVVVLKIILSYRLDQHSHVIKLAVLNTMVKRNLKTIDVGGNLTTSEFMTHVLDEINLQTPEIGNS